MAARAAGPAVAARRRAFRRFVGLRGRSRESLARNGFASHNGGMAEGFDPYLSWLGIRDPRRPPNHYALLGLALFEDDPEVIAHAADRQMAHVRTFQTGPRSAESQRILNELAAAKICLLNPAKKQAYDAALRQQTVAPPVSRAAQIFAPTAAPVAGHSLPSPRTPNVAPPVIAPPNIVTGMAEPVSAKPVAIAVEAGSPPRGVPVSNMLIVVLSISVLVLLGLIVWLNVDPSALQSVRNILPSEKSTPPDASSTDPSPPGNTLAPDHPSPPPGQSSKPATDNHKPGAPPAGNPSKRPAGSGEPLQPPTDKPPTDKPPTDKPAGGTPPVEKPAIAEPATDGPSTKKPLPPRPSTEKPPADKPPAEPGAPGPDADPSATDPPPEPSPPEPMPPVMPPGEAPSNPDTPTMPDEPSDPPRQPPPPPPGERPTQPPETGSSSQSAVRPSREPSARPDPRHEIPSGPAFDEAVKTIRELYAESYSSAVNTPKRKALPDELLRRARQERADAVARYALLNEAYEQAIEVGDAARFEAAVGAIARDYRVSWPALALSGITRAVKRTRDAAVAREYIRLAIQMAHKAADENQMDESVALATAARDMARELALRTKDTRDGKRDSETVREAVAVMKDVEQRREQYAEFHKAELQLAEQPDNAEALRVVGRYHCLVRNDWRRGLQSLAQADETVRKLVEAEGQLPVEPLALADQWFEAASGAEPAVRPIFQARALHWYTRAADGLSGLQRVRVEARIKELKEAKSKPG